MGEKDLGTALIVTMTAFLIFFFAEIPLRFLALSGTGILGVAAVYIALNRYHLEKVQVFWDNLIHQTNLPWQLEESLIGLATGGMFGTGIGNSRLKFEWLPEAHKDFIFSVIGEEIGLMGAIMILALFFIVIYRGLKIAENAPDFAGRLLAGGVIACIGTYAMINTAVALAVVPTTGISMPFISYGGSSLVSHLAALGLVINISSQSNPCFTRYHSVQTFNKHLAERDVFKRPARRWSGDKVRMLH